MKCGTDRNKYIHGLKREVVVSLGRLIYVYVEFLFWDMAGVVLIERVHGSGLNRKGAWSGHNRKGAWSGRNRKGSEYVHGLIIGVHGYIVAGTGAFVRTW